MTSFKQKAREVRAAGEEARGDYSPRGVPKRMYDYWLDETDTIRGVHIRNGKRQENFCHYWRVVAIWAPLMFLRRKAEAAWKKCAGPVGTGLLVLVALAAAFVVVFCSITQDGFLLAMLIILGIIVGGVLAILGLALGLTYVSETKVGESVKSWCRRHDNEIGIAFVSLVVLAFLTPILIGAFVASVLITSITLAGIALLAGIGYVLYVLYQHREQNKPYVEITSGDSNVEEVPAERKRRWYHGFFAGIGDFAILISQVVRVNKWKICPIVKVNND